MSTGIKMNIENAKSIKLPSVRNI